MVILPNQVLCFRSRRRGPQSLGGLHDPRRYHADSNTSRRAQVRKDSSDPNDAISLLTLDAKQIWLLTKAMGIDFDLQDGHRDPAVRNLLLLRQKEKRRKR